MTDYYWLHRKKFLTVYSETNSYSSLTTTTATGKSTEVHFSNGHTILTSDEERSALVCRLHLVVLNERREASSIVSDFSSAVSSGSNSAIVSGSNSACYLMAPIQLLPLAPVQLLPLGSSSSITSWSSSSISFPSYSALSDAAAAVSESTTSIPKGDYSTSTSATTTTFQNHLCCQSNMSF